MSHFDDSPHEMHDNSFTPETADRLLDGEILSPEFAELAAMVSDVRSTVSMTPTPEVRGPLAAFLSAVEASTTPKPRRRSVIAEVIAFAGTVSGKLVIGGSLAAASVTGAQVTGLVELPVLTDEPTTIVTTDKAPAELPLEAPVEAEKPAEEPEPADEPEPAEKPEPAEEPEAIEEEKPAEEAPEEDKAEEKADDKAEVVEEAKPAEDDKKADEKKADDKKTDDNKTDDKASNDEAIAALQAQLANDKEANYTLASDLIAPLETEKKALLAALAEVLAPIEQARNDAKALLYAELETTEDPVRKAEIEAELSAVWDQWIVDRDAAAAAANPAIADLEAQIKAIETNRDVEISRLLTEYQAAVDALG